jgi:hypothetical protein
MRTEASILGRLALGVVLALLALGPGVPPRVSLLAPHGHAELVLAVDGAPPSTLALLRTVARILQADLGLPLPARVTAHVYDGPARFERGLVTYAAVPAARAAELAQFAIGATIPGAVLLRAPALPSLEWPRLIAHELTHLAQIELAGGDTGPAQWVAEGMAEWVAYRIVERLGRFDLEDQRQLARVAAVEYVRRANGLDLDLLATPSGFLVQHRRIGTLVTYRLSLHLAGDLIAQHGFPPMVDYFRAFRVSRDGAANFSASFGVSTDAFSRAALARLAAEPQAELPVGVGRPRA